MSLLTHRAPAPPPEAINAEDDPSIYLIGVTSKIGDAIVGLTHTTPMTLGEAWFELEKWKHSDTTRRFVMLKVTVV